MRKLIIFIFVALLLLFYTYAPDGVENMSTSIYMNSHVRQNLGNRGNNSSQSVVSNVRDSGSEALSSGSDAHQANLPFEVSDEDRTQILAQAQLKSVYKSLAAKGNKSIIAEDLLSYYCGDRITLPLNPADGVRISRGFLAVGGDDDHKGYDLTAPADTPIYAALDGEVVYAGVHKSLENISGVFGYTVIVVSRSADGTPFQIIYPHQNRPPALKVGDMVVRGQQIGVVGSTGHSTGNHLHFEARTGGSAMFGKSFDIFRAVYGYDVNNLSDLKTITGYR